jgi:hypothetical protein
MRAFGLEARPRLSPWIFCAALFLSLAAHAAAPDESVYFSADEYETDLDTRDTRAKGHVDVRYQGRRIRSKRMTLQMETGKAVALDDVIYEGEGITLKGTRGDVDMKAGTGAFTDAVLNYDATLSIEGRRLEYLGKDRYRLENGKLSFCQDCPQAWSVSGSWIEVEIEGYAEVHHALFQIKDRPVVYFPVLYFPVKTKRQTGFLFPQIGYSSDLGTQLSLPYFWAIDKNADATFEYRYMLKGGHRAGSELRWLFSDRSFIQGRASYNRNMGALEDVPNDRYGFSIDQRQQLGPSWVQRYQGELASDSLYTASFEKEFRDPQLPMLINEPSLSWQGENSFAYAIARFSRDNLAREVVPGTSLGPINAGLAAYEIPSRDVFGPWRLSSSLEHLSLHRELEGVDPLTGWIRTGERSTGKLRLFAPLPVLEVAAIDSAFELRGDAYNFGSQVPESSALRGRFYTEQTLHTEVARVFDLDDGKGGGLHALRHSFEPQIRWSYSPRDLMSDHPFFSQVDNPKFDLLDPNSDDDAVQLGTLGAEDRLRPHHLVAVGMGTRLLGRYGSAENPDYRELVGLDVSQTYDLKRDRIGRLNIDASAAYAGFEVSSQVSINVEVGDANVRNEISYARRPVKASLEQSVRTNTEAYQGSIELSPLWRAWTFAASGDYNAITDKFTDQRYRVLYKSKSSRCWFVGLDYRRRPNRLDPDKDIVEYFPNIGIMVSDQSVDL